jgi:transmembrane sensor
METNYNILRAAIEALPKYKMPDATWLSVEKMINAPMQLNREQSDMMWQKIEANLDQTPAIALPTYTIPTDIWSAIENELDTEKSNTIASKKSSASKRLTWTKIAAVAASMAIILTLGIGLTAKLFTKKTPLLSFDGSVNKTMAFEDGSVIISEDNAMVSYPEHFATSNRTIQQNSGKAFFQITKNPEKPFTIQCPAGEIKVLGTSFTTAVGIDSLTVTVKTGKVNVSNSKFSINLLPGEQAILFKDEMKQPIYKDAPIIDSSIQENKAEPKQPLAFADKSIIPILTEIEQTYHCTIRYNENQLKKIKVSGRIPQSNARTMLQTLCEVADLTLQEKSDNLFIITLQ